MIRNQYGGKKGRCTYRKFEASGLDRGVAEEDEHDVERCADEAEGKPGHAQGADIRESEQFPSS
jgi:hypothetical protein